MVFESTVRQHLLLLGKNIGQFLVRFCINFQTFNFTFYTSTTPLFQPRLEAVSSNQIFIKFLVKKRWDRAYFLNFFIFFYFIDV